MLSCRFRIDEKRKNTISHLLCSRCVYDAHPHLKHAPKPHLGWILFFFFLTILNLQFGENGVLQKVGDSWEINLFLLLCSRCIYDAHPHLKHAPKPHLG